MEERKVAKKGSFLVTVKKGKTYYWCDCGRSARQPFCDGSHQTTEYKPLRFVADNDADVWLCGCKLSGKKPYCDGTHKKIV